MSYGTLVMMDGSYRQPPPPPSAPRGGFVGMDRGEDGTFFPQPPSQRAGGNTFVVELNYTKRAYLYGGEKNPVVTDVPVGYRKTFRRLAPGGNPLKAAKEFIAEFAGCPEARKVRGRAIALSRMHKTISGDVFRFPLDAAPPSYLCVRNKTSGARACIPEGDFDKRIHEIVGGTFDAPQKCYQGCVQGGAV